MRITVESEIQNFAATGRIPIVMVDGIESKTCTVADTDAGYVDEIDLAASRGRGGDLVILRRSGAVTIDYTMAFADAREAR